MGEVVFSRVAPCSPVKMAMSSPIFGARWNG